MANSTYLHFFIYLFKYGRYFPILLVNSSKIIHSHSTSHIFALYQQDKNNIKFGKVYISNNKLLPTQDDIE